MFHKIFYKPLINIHGLSRKLWSYGSFRFYSALQRPILNAPLQYRCIHRLFKNNNAENLRIKDNISEKYTLIYRSGMYTYLLCYQIAVMFSLTGGLLLLIFDESEESNYSDEWSNQNEKWIFVVVLLSISTLSYFLIHRTPIRIYNQIQTRNYIFVFPNTIPFRNRYLTCFDNKIVKIPKKGISPWNDNIYNINNKQRMILLEMYFRKPADLDIMLGYQNPSKDYD